MERIRFVFLADSSATHFCQEILQIVRRENDFSLEALRQKVLHESFVSFTPPVLPGRISVDDYLQDASIFPVQSLRGTPDHRP